MKFVLPLLLFLGISVFLFKGLGKDPSLLPSALLNQPVPVFVTDELVTDPAGTATSTTENDAASNAPSFDSASLEGNVWVLNIWASWCVACVTEHPLVKTLAQQAGVPVIGLNYKDTDAEAREWLARFGNPYTTIAADRNGRIGIEFGVYGVPETYIVDQHGTIRYKHTGPIDEEALQKILIPKIKELMASPA